MEGYLDLIHRILDLMLPFAWARYDFMKDALIAVILFTPVFALLGTAVISKRMAFFSDVLGHSALTGIALGVMFGLADPFWMMFAFMVLLAVGINYFKGITQVPSDTALGVFFAVVVALGILILSRGGGFNKFTGYLIGDILTVSPSQLLCLFSVFVLVIVYWMFFGGSVILASINPVLARTRGINVYLVETGFVIILAVLVAVSIKMVGILLVNSLLILPAAASRNIARNVREYTCWGILISLVSGVAGLILSFYIGTSSGATIVLVSALFYAVTTAMKLRMA
ncbi:MAG: metal ABC transporter permease [Candidatus Omnitrophica bacterium]|nr:metal ABC transporter permease [Candidatus Omnitrophota bacterium]